MSNFSASSQASSFFNKKLHQALKTVYECGVKLEAKLETIASAAIYFHKFYKICSPEQFDPMLIGATCIYLAGKVEEDHIKLRDLINVFHATLNRANKMIPLQFDNYYWNLRESLVRLELLMLRVLKFDVNNDLAHRFLLHYLRSINEWIGKDYSSSTAFSQTCWSLLNDYYLNPKSIDHNASHVAIAIIEIAIKTLGIQIPLENEALMDWKVALCENATKDKVHAIISEVLTLYENDDRESASKPPPKEISPRKTPNSEVTGGNIRQYTPAKIIEYPNK
ncbi:cyclin-Q [Tetranychus urticae]|nr:cyclin-Q [Tetranychus urticae]